MLGTQTISENEFQKESHHLPADMLQLKNHPLFYRLNEEEILRVLSCFSFRKKDYEKEEYILLEGDPVQLVGAITRGTVLMEKNDLNGNRYFFTELHENDIFAEPFMASAVKSSSVNYKATANCSILFFHYRDMWRPCEHNCICHSLFTENLMNLLAMKSRLLLAKIEILSKKSLRDRLLSFLNIICHERQTVPLPGGQSVSELSGNTFFIPFNHTEMAEYLCVNRSALVRELSRMKKEGLIDYKGHVYTLL